MRQIQVALILNHRALPHDFLCGYMFGFFKLFCRLSAEDEDGSIREGSWRSKAAVAVHNDSGYGVV